VQRRNAAAEPEGWYAGNRLVAAFAFFNFSAKSAWRQGGIVMNSNGGSTEEAGTHRVEVVGLATTINLRRWAVSSMLAESRR